MLRTIKHIQRELKVTQRNREISNTLGLEDLTLLKWPYYPKKSIDLK